MADLWKMLLRYKLLRCAEGHLHDMMLKLPMIAVPSASFCVQIRVTERMCTIPHTQSQSCEALLSCRLYDLAADSVPSVIADSYSFKSA